MLPPHFLTQIERIYETYSIYQCIMGCPREWVDELEKELLDQNYPVVAWKDRNTFLNMQARALIVPFDVLEDKQYKNELAEAATCVNVVISLGEETMEWVLRDVCGDNTHWLLL